MHKNKLFLTLLLIIPFTLKAQTNVTFDASITYQTIQGFGASDAWSADFVGKYWGNAVKEDIAKKFFAKSFDINGNPEGIGLSRWRFNIGGGSAEQGNSSNISAIERRVECFIDENGTYNWDKQAGQQWFFSKAQSYGVEQLVAFVNSPPRFYTVSGRANSNNTSDDGPTNLKAGYSHAYATFLATVLKHFEQSGIHFAQISPINEPQYKWDKDQEGCPYTNTDIKSVVKSLDTALINSGLSTKILLSEAGSYNSLLKTDGDPNKSDQIYKFFSLSTAEYIGNVASILHGIGGHSYWTDGDDATLASVRNNLFTKSQTVGNIELYQTEFCLLSREMGTYLRNSIYLAKVIYADLVNANVSIWDYWTSLERERWSQKNRFYLIRLRPTGGDYADLTNGGTITADKNLWALGNYSLFIRPGYKRIKSSGATNLAGLMCSSFISPDTSNIVAVYVNMGKSSVSITQTFNKIPSGYTIKSITPYLTDLNNNLQVKKAISPNETYTIDSMSIVTMVVKIDKVPVSIKQINNSTEIKIFPNPTNGLFQIKHALSLQNNFPAALTDITGRLVYSFILSNDEQNMDISVWPTGLYYLKIKNQVHKIIKN